MNDGQQTQANGSLDGYVRIRSDDGQYYPVPHFMIPATHQAMAAYQKKVEFNVHNAHSGVSTFQTTCGLLGPTVTKT
jgi:hypothetical protein